MWSKIDWRRWKTERGLRTSQQSISIDRMQTGYKMLTTWLGVKYKLILNWEQETISKCKTMFTHQDLGQQIIKPKRLYSQIYGITVYFSKFIWKINLLSTDSANICNSAVCYYFLDWPSIFTAVNSKHRTALSCAPCSFYFMSFQRLGAWVYKASETMGLGVPRVRD